MAKISGSCLCGSIEYASAAEPIETSVCHCKDCQRQTGTAFSILVGVPMDSLTFAKQSTLEVFESQGASGEKVYRNFCKKCGSPILSTVDLAPGFAFIKAGTLHDKSWLEPTTHYWCADAQPWVEIAENITKHDQNPA